MNLDLHGTEEPIVIPPRRKHRQTLFQAAIRFWLLIAVIAGTVLVLVSWRAIGWPKVEVQKNDDGTFKEARIVPTLKPWF